MFVVTSLAVAVPLCVLTMLGWGSWANTQKLAGKQNWPFLLYYWDYAIGVFLTGVLLMFTLGSFGQAGAPALSNLAQANSTAVSKAILSGALFNVSNILLVEAIGLAGMAIAFPVGVGLALVLGTLISFVETPKGSAGLLFSGVVLITVAMLVSAAAYRQLARGQSKSGNRGLLFAVVAGLLMGSFYPQLAQSISSEFSSTPIHSGLLTPYTALALFGAGLLASNFVVNTVFMKLAGLGYGEYFRAGIGLHSLGILGGLIWMVALACNVLASGVAGPAISYALGQGATLVAAIWGVFIWKEFQNASASTWRLIGMMFASYAAGLLLIGLATL